LKRVRAFRSRLAYSSSIMSVVSLGGRRSVASEVAVDPVTELVSVEPVTDTWVVRLVVVALGLVALACVVGGLVLAGLGRQVPDTVIALGSASTGALAALLASTRSSRN
jgi:hypothetical protein